MGTRMRRTVLRGSILALMVLVLVGCAHALPPVTWTERRITTDLADQFDPAISGDFIVYADMRGNDHDVWYYDLSQSKEFPVTTAPGDQRLTDVSDGTIVYADYVNVDIMAFYVPSGPMVDITASSGSNSNEPSVGGKLVAWQDDRDGNYEIYAKNLQTGEERRITSSSDADQKPAVNNGIIVWQRCYSSATCDIFSYDWGPGSTRQITSTADGDERSPDISGPNIVYEALRAGEKDIYLFNLGTGVETRLSLAGQQGNPAISGDNVVFDDLSSGMYHVRLWNVPSGAVFDMPAGAGQQFLNDISGNRVVYTDDRNGQLDIYMSEFTFDPPVASFTATPSSGTAPLPVQFTDTSSGEPYLWAWSFGDGGTSSDPSPLHQYTSPGTFTASLTVTNLLGGSATATQTIMVTSGTGTIPVLVDIMPAYCPNMIYLELKGPVFGVAIVGTKDMDVSTINPATITLSRNGVAATVNPRWNRILDITQPYTGGVTCGCQKKLMDGTKDLVLIFRNENVVSTLQLTDVVGQTLPYTIRGYLKKEYGGNPIEGSDCMKVTCIARKHGLCG
jgi:beta propeller repeat protein